MGIKSKGPLFPRHEVGRTEDLMRAHSKACNRHPMWKSISRTTYLVTSYFCKLCSLKILLVIKYRHMYTAICVQSQNYSSSSIMLLSCSRNDFVAILKVSAEQLFLRLNMMCLSDSQYNNCIIISTVGE